MAYVERAAERRALHRKPTVVAFSSRARSERLGTSEVKLIKNAGELRDLAIVYLTRANGSVHDAIEPFEAALFEASPVIAGLFAGPSEALRNGIAAYLDAIQSDLTYVFKEGIARDEAITKALALQPIRRKKPEQGGSCPLDGRAGETSGERQSGWRRAPPEIATASRPAWLGVVRLARR